MNFPKAVLFPAKQNSTPCLYNERNNLLFFTLLKNLFYLFTSKTPKRPKPEFSEIIKLFQFIYDQDVEIGNKIVMMHFFTLSISFQIWVKLFIILGEHFFSKLKFSTRILN